MSAYRGAKRYLEAARAADLRLAAVSASANTVAILESAGLTELIEGCIDGNTIVERHLRAKPAPDILLAACDELRVPPERTAAFETGAAGVEAGRTANLAVVIGIDHNGQADELHAAGADLVIPNLADLLERYGAAAA